MVSRFALLTILASSALHATSFTSATCTLGSTTITGSSCSIPYNVDGTSGLVSADASITESMGSADEGNLGFGSLAAGADAGYLLPPGISGSADASASDTETFATAGPERPGFISLSVTAAGEHGGEASAELTQNQVSFFDGMQPFELGSVFQISVSANASPGGCEFDGCTQAVGIVQFFLTEADGTTGVPFFAVVTPEPASWGLLLFGFGALAVFYVRTRKAGLGSREASAPNSKL